MREIKFRAWNKNQKEMEIPFIIGAPTKSENHLYVLMQYTGLKDKNNKEIYEGDIVSVEYDREKNNYEIRWEDSGMFTIFPYEDGPGFVPTLGFFTMKEDLDFSYEVEVIGNIYENPGFLE